jgi:putative ABC transport system substrate-binding protein
MAAVGDPVGSRFVASLARPGGNITGVTLFQPEVGGRRLRWLKEVVPAVTGVAVLRNPTDLTSSSPLWRATQAAARTLRLQLHSVDARDPTDLARAFAEMARAHDDALCVLPDTLFTTERGRVVALAAQNRLPAVYPGREFVEAGGLMSDAASLRDQFHRAAAFVDKILKGAKPSDLPVEPPTKFEFVINLKVAKALRLSIPPLVLARADEVIQ